ncbi:MAG: dTDP-4-dehydrorhamnose reductase [Anaerolineales bacterium]
MHILLFGGNGQVGWELQRTLLPLGAIHAFDYPQVDFLNLPALRDVVREANPDLIVNAAAYTAVDKAESEPDRAQAVNAEAPGLLAEEARRLGIGLVHYSTDYVFDGKKGAPYTEEDTPNPLNVYGQTKLDGDRAIQASGARHLILRTSWVYGARGSNFFLTMLRLARERRELRVVDDQIGSPTWSRSIAAVTAEILQTAFDGEHASIQWDEKIPSGIYNARTKSPLKSGSYRRPRF